MYTFLYEYLDAQAHMRMPMQEEQYKLTVGATSYYSGPLYLKILLGIAHIDTRSTASHLRETLSSLDKYIVTTTMISRHLTSERRDLEQPLG